MSSNNHNAGLYDPYVAPEQRGQSSVMQGTQDEIKGAIDTMRNNIEQISQRGQRLDQLQTKTEHLSDSAHTFRQGANRVRKQMWWKDMKMRMCIIVGIIVLLVVIIVPSAIYGGHHK